MMKRTLFQVLSLLANSTKKARSALVSCGRLICRRRTINCCRSKAFSTTSSCLLRHRSNTAPTTAPATAPAGQGSAVGLFQTRLTIPRRTAGTTSITKNCTNSNNWNTSPIQEYRANGGALILIFGCQGMPLRRTEEIGLVGVTGLQGYRVTGLQGRTIGRFTHG
jgi:hypothetical protein